MTVRADVERLVGTAVSEFGRIDALCNIAGAMFPGLIEDLDDETIDRGIDLNLKGVLYGTQYAVRAMKPFGRGSIVNVSSAAIDEPYVGIGVYAFTKAAVAMLTMTTALEVGEHGIRVNAIAPGATITPFTTWRLHRPDGTLDQEAYDAFIEQSKGQSPLHTLGEAGRPGAADPLPRVGRGAVRHRQHLPRQRRPDDGLVSAGLVTSASSSTR